MTSTKKTATHRRHAFRIVAGLTAVVVTAGSASAYWKSTGTGNATATAGVGNTILSVAATVTTGLLSPANQPGGYKGTLFFTLSSPVNATVTGMAIDPSRSIVRTGGKNGGTGCLGSVVTLDSFTFSPAISLTGGNSFTGSKAGVVAMDYNAPDTCQGATFTIPVIVTGTAS